MVVVDEVWLKEAVLQFLPIFFSGRFEFLEEGGIGVICDCKLALDSHVISIFKEAVSDAGMVAISDL